MYLLPNDNCNVQLRFKTRVVQPTLETIVEHYCVPLKLWSQGVYN